MATATSKTSDTFVLFTPAAFGAVPKRSWKGVKAMVINGSTVTLFNHSFHQPDDVIATIRLAPGEFVEREGTNAKESK